jgi:hypothetical protein
MYSRSSQLHTELLIEQKNIIPLLVYFSHFPSLGQAYSSHNVISFLLFPPSLKGFPISPPAHYYIFPLFSLLIIIPHQHHN